RDLCGRIAHCGSRAWLARVLAFELEVRDVERFRFRLIRIAHGIEDGSWAASLGLPLLAKNDLNALALTTVIPDADCPRCVRRLVEHAPFSVFHDLRKGAGRTIHARVLHGTLPSVQVFTLHTDFSHTGFV